MVIIFPLLGCGLPARFFQTLSVSIFCSKKSVLCARMFFHVWKAQPASAHGCVFYQTSVRIPARSREADCSSILLRIPNVQFSAYPLAPVLTVPLVQAGGPETIPKTDVCPEQSVTSGGHRCLLQFSALTVSSFHLSPCGATPTLFHHRSEYSDCAANHLSIRPSRFGHRLLVSMSNRLRALPGGASLQATESLSSPRFFLPFE